jgi:RNA polymerase sigma factor (TIGR02999 family)
MTPDDSEQDRAGNKPSPTELVAPEHAQGDVTRILSQIEQGEPHAAEELLPLVYDELRKLAAARMAQEKPGQTLQATALVHEAYLKLVGAEGQRDFANRRHFFAAAAEAMRQILVDRARGKLSARHGGQWRRQDALQDFAGPAQDPAQTLAIDELLNQLASEHPRPAHVAKLRLYLEMTFREIAEVLGLSADTVESEWAYARAWMNRAWQRS